MPSTEKPERVTRRDVRVDQLGFIKELDAHYGDAIKDAIKQKMVGDETELVTGDFFQGLRVEGESNWTDPKKLYKLLKSEQITEADFLSAISVKREACLKFLSQKDLAAISRTSPAATKLVVTRLKDAAPTLVDSIKGLSAELLKEQTAAA